MIKEKLIEAMGKLRNITITTTNAYTFYNMYLTKKVYFGCGVVKLSLEQEEILIKISELVLLKKLGLSENFPREILYARKSALGVGLLKPSTIITILTLKLYLGHMRKDDRIAWIIKINEENAHI